MNSLLLICLLIFLSSSALARDRVRLTARANDLVPCEIPIVADEAYRHMLQVKLLVTPGDIARSLFLPGITGGETAISIYRAPDKPGSMLGGYWLTVTQSPIPLWRCSPGYSKISPPIDPDTIAIERADAPLPEETALMLRTLWLAMLKRVKPEPATESIEVDTTKELFFVTQPDGKECCGSLPRRYGKNPKALFDLTNDLLNFACESVSNRPAILRRINRKAMALLSNIGGAGADRDT